MSLVEKPIILNNTGLNIATSISNFTNLNNSENNAGYHNSIYRGIFLGTKISEDQLAVIKNGSFTDLYVGDYWIINNIIWRIAHFDYYYNTGDTNGVGYCIEHHIIIIPDNILLKGKMNNTNIVTGGYVGSDFYTGNNDNISFNSIKSIFQAAFNSNYILTYRDLLVNAVSGSAASGRAWIDCDINLLSESMVCGRRISGINGNEVALDRTCLALFIYKPELIKSNDWYWLRNIYSNTTFCAVNENGILANFNEETVGPHLASEEGGFRPYCLIYGGITN